MISRYRESRRCLAVCNIGFHRLSVHHNIDRLPCGNTLQNRNAVAEQHFVVRCGDAVYLHFKIGCRKRFSDITVHFVVIGRERPIGKRNVMFAIEARRDIAVAQCARNLACVIARYGKHQLVAYKQEIFGTIAYKRQSYVALQFGLIVFQPCIIICIMDNLERSFIVAAACQISHSEPIHIFIGVA